MQINIDFNKEDLIQYLMQHLIKHFSLEPLQEKFQLAEYCMDILARHRKSKDLVVFSVLKEAAGEEAICNVIKQRELISYYLLNKRLKIVQEVKSINPETLRNLLNAANGVEAVIIAESFPENIQDQFPWPWLQCYTYAFSSLINQTSAADLSIRMNFSFNEVILTSSTESFGEKDLSENELLNQYIKQNYIYAR
ncbi:hypothetical protein Dtox_1229 [Desulfofarcimen acetoxidans DSM 771]|jgi:hypothetical protein|uniref:Uncharacterized protein n=1 Tax=Desulfofarcimen acetoxidans (strain ATCC 49208 / DSM 771 / KCTC 5769 / VKM B-1644 / 5575) TaxID=485916 RepID=C8W5D1_DESAS|nr:hypothetical protein [Desulfofarcimen acetoxidans]ACV62113.1 hypothetical protein Dtox_1229 [Desulfofarcimen acetoxidans DSM 771]